MAWAIFISAAGTSETTFPSASGILNLFTQRGVRDQSDLLFRRCFTVWTCRDPCYFTQIGKQTWCDDRFVLLNPSRFLFLLILWRFSLKNLQIKHKDAGFIWATQQKIFDLRSQQVQCSLRICFLIILLVYLQITVAISRLLIIFLYYWSFLIFHRCRSSWPQWAHTFTSWLWAKEMSLSRAKWSVVLSLPLSSTERTSSNKVSRIFA